MVEAKNIAEQLVYTAEKSLREAGDKVPTELRQSIEHKMTDVKSTTANTSPDIEQIKKTTTELSAELSKIAESLSKAGGADAQQSGSNGGDGSVRDADFEEKKDETK